MPEVRSLCSLGLPFSFRDDAGWRSVCELHHTADAVPFHGLQRAACSNDPPEPSSGHQEVPTFTRGITCPGTFSKPRGCCPGRKGCVTPPSVPLIVSL